MKLNRRQTLSLGLSALVGSSALATTQAYPAKPVTLIVPFSAGGGTDATMRVIANYFQGVTGQPMVIENKPGAGTLIAMNYLKGQKPDGYTLGVMTRAPYAEYWRKDRKLPFHPIEDFSFISGTHGSIFAMVVKQDSPFKNLGDIVEFAKKNPGKLSFGNIGSGTTHNVAALEFAARADIDVIHVAFKGEADSNSAVLGGHVDVGVSSGVFIPQVQAGRMRVLAIARNQRLPEYKDWPTFNEQGFDIRLDTMVGIGGPQGMDPIVVKKIDSIFKRITADPKFHESLAKLYQPVAYIPHEKYLSEQKRLMESEKALYEKYQFNK